MDIARAVAILGMLAVHVGPTDVDGFAGRLYATPHGRASLLFVLVAGVGVTLLSRSAQGTRRTTRAKLLWRSALLLPAGLALQELDHGANVILQDYALFFVLAILALDLSRRWLLGLSIAFAVTGPVLYFLGRAVTPGAFQRAPTTLSEPLLANVQGLVFSGPYPLITWAAPFLFGMWLGRVDLRSTVLRRRLVLAGTSVAFVAFVVPRALVATFGAPASYSDPRFLYTSAAHGQMPLWLIGGTAAAAAVLGLALIAGDRVPSLSWPLAASGQLALTVYVGHLLLLHAFPTWVISDDLAGALVILTVVTVAILLGATLWRRSFDRGPLEYALHPRWLAPRVPATPSAPGTAPGAVEGTLPARNGATLTNGTRPTPVPTRAVPHVLDRRAGDRHAGDGLGATDLTRGRAGSP